MPTVTYPNCPYCGNKVPCCPDITLPNTIYVTISGQSGDAACFPTNWVPTKVAGLMEWRPTDADFCTPHNTHNCPGPGSVGVYCRQQGPNSVWHFSGLDVETDAVSVSCDPFHIAFGTHKPVCALSGTIAIGATT